VEISCHRRHRRAVVNRQPYHPNELERRYSSFSGGSNNRCTGLSPLRLSSTASSIRFDSNSSSSSVSSVSDSQFTMSESQPQQQQEGEQVQQKMMVVDPFCYRQFIEYSDTVGKDYAGTVLNVSIHDFEEIVNQRFRALLQETTPIPTSSKTNISSKNATMVTDSPLKDGYAPFCKHFFLINDFIHDVVVNVLPITNENESLLRTRYMARTSEELPVLIRYFPLEELSKDNGSGTITIGSSGTNLPTAQYFDIILYSREQIELEHQARQQQQQQQQEQIEESTDTATSLSTTSVPSTTTTTTTTTTPTAAPWGIVSIKAQDVDFELPMNPITMMRNALGKEYGGSGIPLDTNSYMECVNYWKDHAIVS
jgi:hypothetical protein